MVALGAEGDAGYFVDVAGGVDDLVVGSAGLDGAFPAAAAENQRALGRRAAGFGVLGCGARGKSQTDENRTEDEERVVSSHERLLDSVGSKAKPVARP
jgi:hypothetical protein